MAATSVRFCGRPLRLQIRESGEFRGSQSLRWHFEWLLIVVRSTAHLIGQVEPNPMAYTGPQNMISPDGRFEVQVEEFMDRSTLESTTYLVERSTGRRLFTCQGSPRAEFTADNLFHVYYPGYDPKGLEIDPAAGTFRTHSSEQWVPLTAWPLVESAFNRGWSASWKYRDEQIHDAGWPWFEGAFFLGLSGALVVLILLPRSMLATEQRVALTVIVAAGALLFAWLVASSLRYRSRIRRVARRGR